MPTRPAARPPKACESAVRCGTAVSGTRESGTPTAKPATMAMTIQHVMDDRRAGPRWRGRRWPSPATPANTPRARGLRVVHPVQREDEQRRRDEVGELRDGVASCVASPRRRCLVLNILSMRSVIRKPLTMLVIEAKSAMAPRIRMRERVVAAGHDDRADDRDRRDGVGERHQRRVQQPRHAADDADADERRQHEHEQHATRSPVAAARARPARATAATRRADAGPRSRMPSVRLMTVLALLPGRRGSGACRTSPSWVMSAPCWMSSAEVEHERLVLGERQQEGGQVAREEQAGVRRHGRGQVERRDDRHAALDDRLARASRARSCRRRRRARSTMTEPGFMPPHHLGGDQPGREHAADQRGGDHDVRLRRTARPAARAGAPGPRPTAPWRSRRRPAALCLSSMPTYLAPTLSICSFTSGRTSVAKTLAPSRRAVAIACRPATAGADHEHLGRQAPSRPRS